MHEETSTEVIFCKCPFLCSITAKPPPERVHYVCVLFFQSQRCLSCSMLQVSPFVQVDNLGAISSKERATPRDMSVAFLAYLDLQAPREPTVPLGPTVGSAFQDEMGETAGKERKVKRGLQVMNDEVLKAPENYCLSLLLFLMGIAP